MNNLKPMRCIGASLFAALMGLLFLAGFVSGLPPGYSRCRPEAVARRQAHGEPHRQYYRARGECEVRLPAVLCRCHGDYGDANGENAVWLDPKPRNFTLATFKCRSTLTGTLPTDEDLYNTLVRGIVNSNMPVWNTFTKQQRADLVAYIKIFSPRWEKEKAGEPIKIPAEPLSP